MQEPSNQSKQGAGAVKPKIRVPGVRHLIAVASGKGGVGKSTTTANLALALKAQGLRVGVLDADIYGPSQPLILGVPENTKPDTHENKYFIPVEAHGLQLMSMGFLSDPATPVVWRGPMIASALSQFLNQTRWNDLDCLLVDMPPGTGDIQLTLTQKFQLSGHIVVTTPQDIALLDVSKAIEMFDKMKVHCFGIVENMSTHTCSACGHEEAIFGELGGQALAKERDIELLGALPLSLSVRQQSDAGEPIVVAQPESLESVRYIEMAAKLNDKLKALPQDAEHNNVIVKL
ncbi:MAG: Mrp/NBP35 family ATP-binding protein [Pseudomonadota bacterium]